MCSGSEAGSYLKLIDFVYHSTLDLRVIQKKTGRSAEPTNDIAMPSPYFAFRALSAKLDGTVNIRRGPGVSKVDGIVDFRRWPGVWPASGSPDEPASTSKPPSPTKGGAQIDGFCKY